MYLFGFALTLALASCGNKGGGEVVNQPAPAPVGIDVSAHPILSRLPKAADMEAFAKSAMDYEGSVPLKKIEGGEDGLEEMNESGHTYWETPNRQILYVVSGNEKYEGDPGFVYKSIYVLNEQLQPIDSLRLHYSSESATNMDYYRTLSSVKAGAELTVVFENGSASYYENTDEGKEETWVLQPSGKFVKKSEKPYSRKFMDDEGQ